MFERGCDAIAISTLGQPNNRERDVKTFPANRHLLHGDDVRRDDTQNAGPPDGGGTEVLIQRDLDSSAAGGASREADRSVTADTEAGRFDARMSRSS